MSNKVHLCSCAKSRSTQAPQDAQERFWGQPTAAPDARDAPSSTRVVLHSLGDLVGWSAVLHDEEGATAVSDPPRPSISGTDSAFGVPDDA